METRWRQLKQVVYSCSECANVLGSEGYRVVQSARMTNGRMNCTANSISPGIGTYLTIIDSQSAGVANHGRFLLVRLLLARSL